MPLGNLTSQFFANVYLNELNYFIKRKLRVKYYLRYVDDFIILYNSKGQLIQWKDEIDEFLRTKLNLKLHEQKSRITNISRGIDFVGYRNFYYYKLLRKRNIRKISSKVSKYKDRTISFSDIFNTYVGWRGFASWANTNILRTKVKEKIISMLLTKI